VLSGGSLIQDPAATALLAAAALALGLALPLYALRARGRAYASFAAVVVALSFPGAVVLHVRVSALVPALAPLLHAAFAWTLAAASVHLASLVRARLRPRWFRWSVSVPGMAFLAFGALAGPWLLVLAPLRALLGLADQDGALGALRWLDLAPFAVVVASLATSLRLPAEVVRVRLGGGEPPGLVRLPVERHRRRPPPPLARRPLRIVQIADPHLGPWQPVHRLQRRIERLLAREPDLVLLTGDFLTMEAQGSPGALARALAPLARVSGRCFAVFGNHDHEAPYEVRAALAANGVRLLVDEAACVETPIGPVQILGADWARARRAEKLHALLARHPRRPGQLRLLLLHDPLGFRDVPKGDVDLTLSGHTHGGQVGLVSLGLAWTVLSRSRWPDHGLFAHGPNRLYVHRGTGFYGFPLRIGVPGEASLLELVPAP
jgi:hypothetical protein